IIVACCAVNAIRHGGNLSVLDEVVNKLYALSAILRAAARALALRTKQSRPNLQASFNYPPQRRLPRLWMPVRNESVCRIMVGTQHLLGMHGRGMSLGVINRGIWAEDIKVARTAHPVCYIDVFEIHKVALIKATNGIESIPAY